MKMRWFKQKISSRFWRAWVFAYDHALRRHLPHGVVSPRYLLPGQSRKIRIHRRLWHDGLPQIPFPLYIMMESFLWLCWVLFFGWRSTLSLVRRAGPEIKSAEDIGMFTLFRRVLGITLFYCVPPAEVYAFRLYRTGAKAHVWDYVFTHEVHAFHHWRSSRRGNSVKSRMILSDKPQTAAILEDHGVGVVPILEVVPRCAKIDLSARLKEYPRLFCKPRRGSAGRGCFVVERPEHGTEPKVFRTEAGIVTKTSTWSCLLEAAARDDYLVQPFMTNHPALAGLCETQDAITVRIITQMQGLNNVSIYSAVLEVPAPARSDQEPGLKRRAAGRGHLILPICPDTGVTERLSEDCLNSSIKKHIEQVYAKLGSDPLPFWDELKNSALTAQALFPDVYAIAWDFVVTPDGPFLLEGNTGWGTRMPQICNGGLLEDETEA